MNAHRPLSPVAGPVTLVALALLLAVAAWGIPARVRGLHPVALEAAGHGTPSTVGAAEAWAASGKPGPAGWLAAAAAEAGLPGTNTLAARVAASMGAAGARTWGGAAPQGAPVLAPVAVTNAAGAVPAADLFLAPDARRAWRQRMESARSPGARAIWAARAFAPRRFVAVDRPGGQPLEAMLLLMAALQEHGHLADGLGAGVQAWVANARAGQPADGLEQACLDLLVLSRRLDWTSLGELLRTIPDPVALRAWTEAVQGDSHALPVLYAASVLSGRPDAMAGRCLERGGGGRGALLGGLRGGEGSLRWLGRSRGPLLEGAWGWPWLGRWAARERVLAGWLRLGLLGVASALAGLGMARAMGSPVEGGAVPVRRAMTLTWVAALILMLPAEPLPWPGKAQGVVARLATPGVQAGQAGKLEPGKRWKMEASTLGTIAVFGALQAAVYVMCRRKIAEVLSMPEPAAMRLRLLENEENLFDAGLYVGIAGTATALVLQVVHLAEANLLAAYSSNLMGIVTVALVKIVHVRQARRGLIIEARPVATA